MRASEKCEKTFFIGNWPQNVFYLKLFSGKRMVLKLQRKKNEFYSTIGPLNWLAPNGGEGTFERYFGEACPTYMPSFVFAGINSFPMSNTAVL